MWCLVLIVLCGTYILADAESICDTKGCECVGEAQDAVIIACKCSPEIQNMTLHNDLHEFPLNAVSLSIMGCQYLNIDTFWFNSSDLELVRIKNVQYLHMQRVTFLSNVHLQVENIGSFNFTEGFLTNRFYTTNITFWNVNVGVIERNAFERALELGSVEIRYTQIGTIETGAFDATYAPLGMFIMTNSIVSKTHTAAFAMNIHEFMLLDSTFNWAEIDSFWLNVTTFTFVNNRFDYLDGQINVRSEKSVVINNTLPCDCQHVMWIMAVVSETGTYPDFVYNNWCTQTKNIMKLDIDNCMADMTTTTVSTPPPSVRTKRITTTKPTTATKAKRRTKTSSTPAPQVSKCGADAPSATFLTITLLWITIRF